MTLGKRSAINLRFRLISFILKPSANPVRERACGRNGMRKKGLAKASLNMVKRISHETADCPIARSLDAIGDWWSLLIIRDAFGGRRRFGEFQTNIGVAKNILAARLRNLVAHGILEMVPAADGSAYQDYVLTEKGRDLFPVLVAIGQWGRQYFFDAGESFPMLVDRQAGKPVRALELHAHDGRLLGPEDVVLKAAAAKPARGRSSVRR
jgi:DNA-binding HxlR family transcriptional regulator